MSGRRQGGSGVGHWGWWGRTLHHAAFPPPPASVWRVPISLCQEPSLLGRHCPAGRSLLPAVCFLSHFAKCLLIFSTKRVRAKGSSHYSRKHFQLLAFTKNPTTNRKGYVNQHQ